MSDFTQYSLEPEDQKGFTREFDRLYSRSARIYDWVVKVLPIWRNWIQAVLPHIQGSRVLEASFGTGYLLTRYAGRFQTCGIDYNVELTQIAARNLQKAEINADLQVASVEALPYKAETFDTLVNTMAFTGYPDAHQALAELHRVLRPGGKLLLVDINYPSDRNRLGMWLTRAWQAGGDLIRAMSPLFDEYGFSFTDEEIGGFGSVHLYVAEKETTMSSERLNRSIKRL